MTTDMLNSCFHLYDKEENLVKNKMIIPNDTAANLLYLESQGVHILLILIDPFHLSYFPIMYVQS